MKHFFLFATILMLPFVGLSQTLDAKYLTGTSIDQTYYVDCVYGDDLTGQKGSPWLPYKTIYAWSGSGAPTGVTTMITDGESMVIQGYPNNPYFIPSFGLLPANVTITGVGNPVLIAANYAGANETDFQTRGPLFQPASGMKLSGVIIIATNSYSSNSYDCAFGLYDYATYNIGFANKYPVATNWVCRDCEFYGDYCGVRFYNFWNGGTNNGGSFFNCTFIGGYNAVYNTALGSNPSNTIPPVDNCTAIDCTYIALGNSGYYNNIGQGCAIHMKTYSTWNDIGGNCTVYFTSANTVHDEFVYPETAFILPQVLLNGTRFVWAANQTIFNPEIYSPDITSVQGWYFNTNGFPVYLNTNYFTAINVSSLNTTGTITSSTVNATTELVIGPSTNTPSFTAVFTNWIDGAINQNQTGRNILVQAPCWAGTLISSTHGEYTLQVAGTTVDQLSVYNDTAGTNIVINHVSYIITNGASFSFTNLTGSGTAGILSGGFYIVL